jgi:hypothetical protein
VQKYNKFLGIYSSWEYLPVTYIYDKFHRKEKINSFFLLILRETKFFGGLVLLIASNL